MDDVATADRPVQSTPARIHKSVQQYIDELPAWPDGTKLKSAPMTGMQWRIWSLAAAGKFFEGYVVFMTGAGISAVAYIQRPNRMPARLAALMMPFWAEAIWNSREISGSATADIHSRAQRKSDQPDQVRTCSEIGPPRRLNLGQIGSLRTLLGGVWAHALFFVARSLIRSAS